MKYQIQVVGMPPSPSYKWTSLAVPHQKGRYASRGTKNDGHDVVRMGGGGWLQEDVV